MGAPWWEVVVASSGLVHSITSLTLKATEHSIIHLDTEPANMISFTWDQSLHFPHLSLIIVNINNSL